MNPVMSTGGALPSCSPDAGLDNAVACGYLVEAGGITLNTNFTADVTVTAVAGVGSANPCPANGTKSLSLAAADGRTWNLDFNVTGLPANFIRTGDTLGLTVASWVGGTTIGGPSVSQSVVVTRGGETILITWTGTADARGTPHRAAVAYQRRSLSPVSVCQTTDASVNPFKALVGQASTGLSSPLEPARPPSSPGRV